MTKLWRMERAVRATASVVMSLTLVGCGITTWHPAVHPVGDLAQMDTASEASLKVHMNSGELYVLQSWTVPEAEEDLIGSGVLFDMDRIAQASGSHSIPVAEIALLETNHKEVVSRLAFSGLTAFSGLAVGVTLACVIDPKSCFGSCPTFYASDDPDRPLAEGFSSSFARSLEERDVDWLGRRVSPGPFALVMRNEALETHAVRHVKLLVTPAVEGGEVLPTGDGGLLATMGPRPPTACWAAEGECLSEISQRDDLEYAPRTDATDLASREELVVDFGAAGGDLGLVLSARNSFVTTYVFYQSLSYAGRKTGDLLADLERGVPGVEDRVLGMARELGGIEVFVGSAGGSWERAGEFDEAGPIAADRQVVRLGRINSPNLRVMLRMARGSWRIDEIGLTEIDGPVSPVRLEPDSVTADDPTDPRPMERLTSPDEHLVTVPGDAYRIWFTIPDGEEYHVLLDSQGYYYEWVREGWLRDENDVHAASVLHQPREALKMMAPGFKKIEPGMERVFWSSRFRR